MKCYFLSLELIVLLMASLGFVSVNSGKTNTKDKLVANEAAKQFLVPALQAFMQAFWYERRYTPIDFLYSIGPKPFTYPTAVPHGEGYDVNAMAEVITVGSRKELVQCKVKVVILETRPDGLVLRPVEQAKCHFTNEPPQIPPQFQPPPQQFPPQQPRPSDHRPRPSHHRPRPSHHRPRPSDHRPRPSQQHNGGPEEARPNYNGQQSSWKPPSRPSGFPQPYPFDGRQNSHKLRPPQQPRPPPPKHRKRRKIQRYLQQHLGLDNYIGNRWRA